MPNALKWVGAGAGLWLLTRIGRRDRRDDPKRPDQRHEEDELVDEAIAQSFPASDPPSRW